MATGDSLGSQPAPDAAGRPTGLSRGPWGLVLALRPSTAWCHPVPLRDQTLCLTQRHARGGVLGTGV